MRRIDRPWAPAAATTAWPPTRERIPTENYGMHVDRLGPYRIVRRLGRGGMGTVFHGVNTETGEEAAVKLLATALAHDEGFRDRFASEIETLKKLHHPNIVRLFGFGRQDDLLYYAMELIGGSSLEEELRRGRRFHWREVSQVGIQTARALRHAHDRGIIHRDLKPANLLLAFDGTLKLSDFGIARLFGNTQLTAPGNVVGTVEYMAPEQAEGRPVGPKADLYSLGAVMYVLLTGRPVFRTESLFDAINKHRTERPEPVSRYAADVPEAMDAIVMQLLEKSADARVANATLLVRQLEALEHALSVAGQTLVRPSREGEGEAPSPNDAEGVATTLFTVMRPGAPKPVAENSASEVRQPAVDALPETRTTDAFQSVPADKPDGPSDAAAEFVEVDEDELDPLRSEEQRPALVSVQTWILIALLVMVGAGVWYMLQPPTADALYKRIAPRVESESIDSLLAAQDDIDAFLARFPGDPRAPRLREHLREIELHRLQRRFDLRLRGLAESGNLLPIEQAYIEAMHDVRARPERTAARLEALLALYSQEEASGRAGLCLELARRRLQEIRRQLAEDARQHLRFLEERLQAAARMRDAQPGEARKIYEAIIELYREKPWAADAVREAHNGLKQLEWNDP